MKKILLSVVFCALSVLGFAENKTYTDDLVVTINNESTPAQKTDIQVEFLENNKCNLSLKNFCLELGGEVAPVGNIELNDIDLVDNDGYQTFEVNRTITITPGDLPGADMWLGTMLGEVPIVMTGKINDDKLYCQIDIDMTATLGQTINVTFGSDFNNSSNIKTYTDDLIVTINEESTPAQKTDIQVEFLENNKCNLSLKNFCLELGGEVAPVGNIEVNDIDLVDNDGYQTFEVNRTITITPGDLPEADMWLGTMLGEVPIVMTGKINDDKLYCQIDIDMTATLGQIIKVTFGSDITTSIHQVSTENGKINVYSINGVCVAKNVEATHALDNLKKGIYIVNGQKVIKK